MGEGRGVQEADEFALGVFHEGFFEVDGVGGGHEDGRGLRGGAAAAGGGCGLGPPGLQQTGNAEGVVDVFLEAVEVAVGAQEKGEPAFGGGVSGQEFPGDGLGGWVAGQEPFEGESFVQGQVPAETDGQAAVAEERAVGGGDAVGRKPALEAGAAGGDAAGAGPGGVVAGRGVEGRGEVGQTGAEAQAEAQGAGAG